MPFDGFKTCIADVTDMELTTASYDAYVAAVKDLTTYKEQLEAICLEQTSVKDLFNYSAMIVGESSSLLSSLVEENERCSKKIAELVSGMHFGIMDYLHLLIQYLG